LKKWNNGTVEDWDKKENEQNVFTRYSTIPMIHHSNRFVPIV